MGISMLPWCFCGEDGSTVLSWRLPWRFHGSSMGTPMGLPWKHSAYKEISMAPPLPRNSHDASMEFIWDGISSVHGTPLCFHRTSTVLPWGLPWCFHGDFHTFMVLPWCFHRENGSTVTPWGLRWDLHRSTVLPWRLPWCFHGASIGLS